jgi:hypothetical protein
MLGSDEKHKLPYLLKFRSFNLKTELRSHFPCIAASLLEILFLTNLLLLLTRELSFM